MNTLPKFIIALLALIGSVVCLRAQTNTFPTSGNVGIGTLTPQQALDLGDGTWGRSIVWSGGGSNWYASIGTSYSSASLNLLSGLKLGTTEDNYFISHSGTQALSGIRLDYYNGDISFFGQPRGPLVAGTSFDYATNTKLIVKADGGVGIGTETPLAKLDVAGTLRIDNPTTQSNYFATLAARYDSSHPFSLCIENNMGGTANEVAGVYSPVGGGYLNLALGLSGNVGIGTTNPTQKLSVNGTVRAKEVIVDSGWSDYVFDESYKLKALSETEAFIKAEKHLPGIPSAQDVAEHGISLGEMQAKLLAKIEELTLHQIEQQKQLAAQSARIERLEGENARLARTIP